VTLPFAHDPAFPHRDALLDPAFVAARLVPSFDWAARVTRSERVRATYRMGGSLRMLYRFEAGGAEYNVAAHAFRPGRSARAFEKAVAAADTSHAEAPGVVHDPGLDAVFWLFPNDRRVATLRTIEAARAFLSPQLLRPWVQSRLVAWAPENSATFQCLDAAGAVIAYAKVGARARSEYERYMALTDALAQTSADLRVPRPIAFSPVHDTMLVESVAGRLLTYEPHDMRAMGIALGHLHGLPLAGLPRFDRSGCSARREAVDLITRSIPSLASAVEGLAAELSAREEGTGQPGCLHGDVHPKNALVSGSRVTLIDVEDMAIGPRAADLGSLLARLLDARTSEECSPAAARAGAAALLDGYSTVSAVPEAGALRWHTAASVLVERAQRTVTRIYERGLRHLDAQLAEATRLLVGHEPA